MYKRQAKWDASLQVRSRTFSGALSFNSANKFIPEFRTFLRSVSPSKYPNDIFIKKFWRLEFDCNLLPPYALPPKLGIKSCTGQEKLDGAVASHFDVDMSPLSYSIYKAVFGIARALHKLLLGRTKRKSKGNGPGTGNFPLWKVILFDNRNEGLLSVEVTESESAIKQ